MTARKEDDLTGAALVTLMRLSFLEQGLELPEPIPFVAPNRPHASLSGKTQLAEAVLAIHGPAPLLRVGSAVPRMAFDPIGAALLAARDGPELFARWSRLERYVHLRHPILMDAVTATSARLVHQRAPDDPPSAGVDLVLAGVMAGLLAGIGSSNIRLRIGNESRHVVAIDGANVALTRLPPDLTTHEWRFYWTASGDRSPTGSTADPNRFPNGLADEIAQLLRQDLQRLWPLAAVARHFGLSARTLQRRLSEKGHTLQALRCTAQVERATELLLASHHSVTTIGYACGFADSAHFTRVFKAAAGMTPAAYRAAGGASVRRKH